MIAYRMVLNGLAGPLFSCAGEFVLDALQHKSPAYLIHSRAEPPSRIADTSKRRTVVECSCPGGYTADRLSFSSNRSEVFYGCGIGEADGCGAPVVVKVIGLSVPARSFSTSARTSRYDGSPPS